ncbi:MAG: hypothetical protein IPL70_13520 [Uliginosibacterium sp.]|nr:hypothetical protein [Uliginosibacterium sp.]
MRALTEQAAQTNALERFLADYDGWIVPAASLPAFPHHAPSRTFGIFNVYDNPLRVDGKAVPYYVATQSYATSFSVAAGPVISMPAGLSTQGSAHWPATGGPPLRRLAAAWRRQGDGTAAGQAETAAMGGRSSDGRLLGVKNQEVVLRL